MSDKIAIVYYSYSGNTEKIAHLIAEWTGGELIKIQPLNNYPVIYNEVVDAAKKEIREGFLPELQEVHSLHGFDIIIIGSPNWWSTLAPPVTAYLSSVDLARKTVIPFCTHRGGGLAGIPKKIESMCPDSVILEGLEIFEDGGTRASRDVHDWIKEISLDRQIQSVQ